MSLSDLLELNLIRTDFNIDIVGKSCHRSVTYNGTPFISYSGEFTHDFYRLVKAEVPKEYLSYNIVEIYGYDDELSITIEKGE